MERSDSCRDGGGERIAGLGLRGGPRPGVEREGCDVIGARGRLGVDILRCGAGGGAIVLTLRRSSGCMIARLPLVFSWSQSVKYER